MLDYPKLESLLGTVGPTNSHAAFGTAVTHYLMDTWIADYRGNTPETEIVETSLDTFHYLFDVLNRRLISAWGITGAPNTAPRDKSRMRGHPNAPGPLYHRGHAMPHSAGGGLDINLVPQLGSVNMGAFRVLEKRALTYPGSLYFTYWKYAQPSDQTPNAVQQGLLRPGEKPELSNHQNY